MAWWDPVHVSLSVMMCVIAKLYMSGPRISMKYHFGSIDSHTQRKRYGKVALRYFYKKKHG